MPDFATHAVFGPNGRRITRLAASPDGRSLACLHVPQDFATSDYHWMFFRQEGAGFAEIGTLPERPKNYRDHRDTLRRVEVVPLDDGRFIVLEKAWNGTYLVSYDRAVSGWVETSRWRLAQGDCWNSRVVLLPSGREGLYVGLTIFEGHSDWTGGSSTSYRFDWHLVDLATGAVRESVAWETTDSAPLEPRLFEASRGPSVLGVLSALPWLSPQSDAERTARRQQVLACVGEFEDSPIRCGARYLLTSQRVVEIATGEAQLGPWPDPAKKPFSTPRKAHDISPDEKYVAATGDEGDFELWNLATDAPWRPILPAHGGVHTALFLPGGRIALGTVAGGIFVVDCREGLAAGDAPW